jgi:hypothetical protein
MLFKFHSKKRKRVDVSDIEVCNEHDIVILHLFSVLWILISPYVSTLMCSLMQTTSKVYDICYNISQTSIGCSSFLNIKTKGNSEP